jgi:hypothetical protein
MKSDRRYRVNYSQAMAQRIHYLHGLASRFNVGAAFVASFKTITECLENDPLNLGDLQYHLQAMRMEVRTCALSPVVVHFAVHREERIVYIKGVKLLFPAGASAPGDNLESDPS